MLFLLLSIFGLIVSDRFVYRLEMFNFIFPRFRKIIFVVLNLPSVFFLFFKEHYIYFTTYIGVILLSLTFLNVYFEIFLKKVFLQAQIRVLEAINLNVKAGKSPLKAAKLTFNSLSKIEKMIFEPLNHVEVEQKVPIYAQKKIFANFFAELFFILRSHNRISEQIEQFKRGLRIQNNLRHKSRLATVQVRAQAIVAVFIYIFLLFFSFSELQLARFPEVIVVSLILMSSGVALILMKGEKIKWTI